MSATKLSDLLPIPDGVTNPNAYQVFGLRSGETDVQRIKSAVKSVYQNLKTSKRDADPELWKTAAKLASTAKDTLEDPTRRARLDAQVSASAGQAPPISGQAPPSSDVPPPPSSAIPATPTSSQSDPLAAVLPAGDPLAALLPKSNPLAPAAAPETASPPSPGFAPPPQPQSNPTTSAPVAAPSPSSAAVPAAATAPAPSVQSPPTSTVVPAAQTFPTATPTANVGIRPNKRTRRRRKSGGGMVVLGLTVFGLLGIISGLVYFLYKVPPSNSINDTDGPTSIVNPPVAIADNGQEKPRGDGVMGDVGTSGLATQFTAGNENGSGTRGGSGLSGPGPGNEPMTGAQLSSSMNRNSTPNEVASAGSMSTSPGPTNSNPSMTASQPDVPAPMPNEPMETAKPELTLEQVAENEKAIDEVIELIRGANFETMKSAANAVTERQLSEDQTKRAFALYHIADLASFYKGAIQEGLGTLKTSNTFEYADGLRMIVVEKSDSSLTVMFNRKNRTYTLDNMPLRMAEKLATFALDPTKPDSQAAKALYESVRKNANVDYRKATIETLQSLDGQLETVDVADVIEMLNVLYPST